MSRLVDFFEQLERPQEGRLLLGVCAGLAGPAQLDVTLVRLALVLLCLASGVGLVVYLLLWLLIPAESAVGSGLSQTVRENIGRLPRELRAVGDSFAAAWSRREHEPWPKPASRRWVGVGLIGGGVVLLLYSLGLFAWLGPVRLVGLAVIALGASLIFNLTPHWRR